MANGFLPPSDLGGRSLGCVTLMYVETRQGSGWPVSGPTNAWQSLNRTVMLASKEKTWTAHGVSSLRRVRGAYPYKPAESDGRLLPIFLAHE